MASKFIVPFELPNYLGTPADHADTGFVLMYVKHGWLTKLAGGVETDLVLQRPLDGFNSITAFGPIVETDTVLEAFKKLQAGIASITLTGDVTGTAIYDGSGNIVISTTAVGGPGATPGIWATTVADSQIYGDVIINGDGNIYSWAYNSLSNFGVSGLAVSLVSFDNASTYSTLDLDSTTALLGYADGTYYTYISLANKGSEFEFKDVSTGNRVGLYLSNLVVKLRTNLVNIGTATNGQVLKLTDASTGQADWGNIDWANITGAPSFLTAEVDTLATVTARGATTTGDIAVNGKLSIGTTFAGLGQYITANPGAGTFDFVNSSGGGFSYRWIQNASTAMTLSTQNNLLIGTTTDSGYRIDVSGTGRIISSTEQMFRVEHTNGNYMQFTVGNGSAVSTGAIGWGLNGANLLQMNSSTLFVNVDNIRPGSSAINFLITGGGTATSLVNSITLGSNTVNVGVWTATTGVQNTVSIGSENNAIWSPSSGTAEYNVLRITPRLNTTGSYSGTVRGLYINPTLTSIIGAAYYSIDVTDGKIRFGGLAGAGTRMVVADNNGVLLTQAIPGGGGGTGTVTSVSVVSANGFAGTVATATVTPAITISTTITGLLKGNGTAISAASAGTDYQAPITLTTTGSSGASTFILNTLNVPTYTLAGLGGQPLSTNLTSLAALTFASTAFVKMTAAGTFALDTNTYYLSSNPSGYTNNTGTVTTVSVTTANGISGTVATAGTTPAITLTLGAITPTSVNSVVISGSTTPTLAVTGTSSISGSNTGDNAVNSLYSGLVSNATHTGDATGATALTVVGLRSVVLPALGASAGNLRYTGTGTNTWVFDTATYLTANQSITLSGDISGTGTTAITTTIGANKVTNAMLAQVATASFLGRVTAATGNVETLTGTQATTLLDVFSSTLKGLVPASGGGTTNFLRADGTWTTPGGGGSVTSVSVTTANGISGTVATATSTPAITLTLGAITPTSVNSVVISGSTTPTLSVTGTSSISGSNTGDNAVNSLYSGLVSNATHTGDATGATALTVVGLRSVALPTLGASAGNLRYTGTGTNTWIFDTATYLTANQSITLSGDVSGTGTTAITTTLATVTQSTGANFVKITLDTKGRVTGNTTVAASDLNSTFGSQTANTVYAAPNGAAGNPSFRALVAADIPVLSYQASSTNLTSLAGLTFVSTSFVKMTAAGTFALDTNTYLTANQSITLSGDISGTGTTAITTTIGANKVTNSMLAQVATGSFLGRVTAATGNVETLTGTQATTLIDVFSSTLKGAVPASGGGTTNFLRADGTWTTPGGGGSVTTVSVVSANGFAGTVATATSTPAITLTTTITGLLKGNGTAISAATAGTDYQAALTGTGFVKSTAGTISYDTNTYLTANQSITFTPTGDVSSSGGSGATSLTPAITVTGLRGVALPTLGVSSGMLRYTGTGINTWIFDNTAYLTANQSITLSGDVSGTGTTAITATLATVTQSTGANFVKITLDTKGRVTGNTTVAASDLNTTFGSQTAATFYAAPNATAGNPSFRAIVAADIPTLNQNTSGTAGSVSGTNVISNANIRQSVARSVIGNATNATANVADISTATADQVLISTATALVWSTITTAAITNSAVTYAKIQNVSATNRLLGRSTTGVGVVEEITVGGDLSQSGSTFTIANAAVSLTKMANLAANSIIGNNTISAATPLALTGTQVTAMLDNFTSTTKGLVPLSGGGTTNFLRADGTWAAPAGGGGGGTTTNALTINNGGAGVASGSTFNGSAAITISYNSIGALAAANPAYTGVLATGTLTYSATNHMASLQSSVNAYNQFVVQNSNAGITASSDLVVNNDVSTDTTFYGDFGMNSSGFTGSGSFNLPSAVYLASAGGDLVLGTYTSNAIRFVINSGTTDAFRIGTTGNLMVNQASDAGYKFDVNGTSRFQSNVLYGVGTATNAPFSVTLTSAVLKTTAAAGDFEVDTLGVPYYTYLASSRGIIDTTQYMALSGTYTLTSQTAAQKLFNATTNGAITLQAGTTYLVEVFYSLSSISATSGTFGFAFGGTATYTSLGWHSFGYKTGTTTTATTAQSTYNVTAANTTLVTANTSTVGQMKIIGILRVNAGGTMIPQVSLGVAAAAVVGANSYCRVTPIGTNTVTTLGNWS